MKEVKKTTPMKAIRRKCVDCCLGIATEVKECVAAKCPLYDYRSGKRPPDSKPLRTIRLKCLDCTGNGINDIRTCKLKDCPLYVYRFGHRPKGEGSQENDE